MERIGLTLKGGNDPGRRPSTRGKLLSLSVTPWVFVTSPLRVKASREENPQSNGSSGYCRV
ncbi:hypothetical protein MPNT_60051 [Candidatus Methylacidithermus pantelleriae]|uniref:Uncharacterized protein n=1 Tax=Candidatus Methylacidithermus pantelleriae TaxID=2744239 RepID=A0A8J2BS75_9BACT|nr:hypothetical protein MPNT_60051 [Candidatus Methylacidithermus pantelleriae]